MKIASFLRAHFLAGWFDRAGEAGLADLMRACAAVFESATVHGGAQ